MPATRPARRTLLLLAAGWIAGALPAAAQPAPPAERPRLSPEQRAQRRQLRAEMAEHVGVARSAIATRNAAAATEALERAETAMLNLQAARAGATPDGATARGGRPGARAKMALDRARGAVGRQDFAAADAALRPLAERLAGGGRR